MYLGIYWHEISYFSGWKISPFHIWNCEGFLVDGSYYSRSHLECCHVGLAEVMIWNCNLKTEKNAQEEKDNKHDYELPVWLLLQAKLRPKSNLSKHDHRFRWRVGVGEKPEKKSCQKTIWYLNLKLEVID